MNKITCYIVDDEQASVESLAALLKLYCPSVQIQGSATTIAAAFDYLSYHAVDVLFLDIKMQGETGFDLLRQLNKHHFHLIFVTAYDEYGIQAIKFSAMDYLLKPVNPAELIAAMHKVTTKKQLQEEQLQMLLQSHRQQDNLQQKRIALSDQSEINYVFISDIICCKSENSYTVFYLSNSNTSIVVSKPISEYENLLQPYGFLRTHQSWLINTIHIKAYKKEDGGYLVMEKNISVPVSRQRRHMLKTLTI